MSGKIDAKYGELSKDIVDYLQPLEYEYFREDKPVPFCGLTVYPIKVRDFEIFSNCTTCLTLNKNEDPNGVAMSHLDYLFSKLNDPVQGKEWSFKFQKLCELVFHITNGLKCKKCGEILRYDGEAFVKFVNSLREFTQKNFTEQTQTVGEENSEVTPPELICPHCEGKEFEEEIKFSKDPKTNKGILIIDGKEINKKDYNKLRQLILYQNFYDYVDDSWVDPAVKKDHDEKIRIQQQKNDVHATIEKKVVCLSISTHYSFEEIYDMSIRKFTLALATVDDLINYKIMKQAVMSGFTSLPKGQTIEHWIYKPNKDIYGDSYKSTDQIEEAVSHV